MAIDPATAQPNVIRPQVLNVASPFPTKPAPQRVVHLNLKRTINDGWEFRFISKSEDSNEMVSMSGFLYIPPLLDTRPTMEFGILERLVTHVSGPITLAKTQRMLSKAKVST